MPPYALPRLMCLRVGYSAVCVDLKDRQKLSRGSADSRLDMETGPSVCVQSRLGTKPPHIYISSCTLAEEVKQISLAAIGYLVHGGGTEAETNLCMCRLDPILVGVYLYAEHVKENTGCTRR